MVMFLEIRSVDDRRIAAGILISNGYTVSGEPIKVKSTTKYGLTVSRPVKKTSTESEDDNG
jgi:hypothetical protein